MRTNSRRHIHPHMRSFALFCTNDYRGYTPQNNKKLIRPSPSQMSVPSWAQWSMSYMLNEFECIALHSVWLTDLQRTSPLSPRAYFSTLGYVYSSLSGFLYRDWCKTTYFSQWYPEMLRQTVTTKNYRHLSSLGRGARTSCCLSRCPSCSCQNHCYDFPLLTNTCVSS